METLKKINLISKLTLFCAITMFVYGILSRLIPIYFFWESLYLSGIVFMVGVFLVLHSEIKKRKSESKSNTLLIIGKGFVLLSIGMFSLINLIFSNSDAFTIMENYIKADMVLKNEIGEIKEIVALPIGTVNSKMNGRGKSGNATLTLLIKGEKKYKEMLFSAQKDIDTDWRIIDKN